MLWLFNNDVTLLIFLVWRFSLYNGAYCIFCQKCSPWNLWSVYYYSVV